MIRVCVLGSIASGKSFISKLFNCPIFNADMEVVDIYKKDKSCFKKLNKKFPNHVKSFPIKKSELINAISSNNKSLKLISSIVHPIVRERMKKFLIKEMTQNDTYLRCNLAAKLINDGWLNEVLSIIQPKKSFISRVFTSLFGE